MAAIIKRLAIVLFLVVIAVIMLPLPAIRVQSFSRVGTLALNTNEGLLTTASIDAAGSFAYFSGMQGPVVKVNLSNFSRVANMSNEGSGFLQSTIIDPGNGFSYFGVDGYIAIYPFGNYSQPASIDRIRLSDLTRTGSLRLNYGEINLMSAVLDSTNGFAYFGAYTSPGIIVKIRLSDFTRVGALTLNQGEDLPNSAVIDSANGFAYFGTSAPPMKIVKIRLSDFSRVGALTLNPAEGTGLHCAVIDTGKGFAYFGTFGSPGRVERVKLSDFTLSGTLTLESGEDLLSSAVIDSENGFAYFGTFTSPGIVVKVDLSTFRRAGALRLSPEEQRLTSAVVDAGNGFAYFGTKTWPGYVVKINIGPETQFNVFDRYLIPASIIVATIITAYLLRKRRLSR